jgi:uncharacterized small protein (DUF1192 family)
MMSSCFADFCSCPCPDCAIDEHCHRNDCSRNTPPASAPETTLLCPEPGNCAAAGKCGEGSASSHETSERYPGTFTPSFRDFHPEAPPATAGELTHGNIAHGGCPACNALIAALRAEVERLKVDLDQSLSTGLRVCELTLLASLEERLAAKTEECGRLFAELKCTEKMTAEIAALRASLAESEKEIETLKIGEDSKVERLRAQMRSDHELCAIEHDREKARADAAIAERDALRQIVEEAPCLCLTKYLPKHSPHCWKAKARAKENA